MTNTTKIYLVTNCFGDPNKVYIGKTKNSRKQQHKLHLGSQNTYDYIDEVNSLDSKDWKPLECFWIEQFRQWGFILINKNKGGGGPSYRTKEYNKKLSLKTKGKSKPDGFGKLISEIKLSQNIKMSDETKQKISISKINHPCFQTQSFRAKHYKSIIQLNKEYEIINEFKSIDEAISSNGKFKSSNISCCLTGISKTAYGFKWIYKNI